MNAISVFPVRGEFFAGSENDKLFIFHGVHLCARVIELMGAERKRVEVDAREREKKE